MNGGLKDKILLIFQILGSFSYPKYWHAAIQSLFILLLMIIQQMRNKCIQLLFINGHKLNMNPIWLHLLHTVMSKRHHFRTFSIWTNDTSEIPRPTSKSDQIKTKTIWNLYYCCLTNHHTIDRVPLWVWVKCSKIYSMLVFYAKFHLSIAF